ncbi:MAG: LytTR family DNA-binding domain-containing protein [Bacteroidia bacterium]|nr:LytTR family DNA-binding domain-containing protein [Bacteroidia bacterium]
MSLRCITVDDESPARKLIEENIRQIPFLEYVGSARNAFEAIELLQREQVDLMFLDIQMPGMMGTKFLQSLREKPLVIFVTAYANFALESYELEVVDYLMKPVSMERFTRSVLKAKELFDALKALATQAKDDSPKMSSIDEATETGSSSDYFFVNVEYALVKIMVGRVCYVEGMKDYVKIYLEGEKKPVLTKATLKSIEEKLPSSRFMRVHKSYIADLTRVDAIRGNQISIGTAEIPVSETNIAEVMRKIGAGK